MNLDKYNEVFMRVFEVDVTALNAEFKFGEAPNWDSLAHMELIAELEDCFGVMLDTNDITHFGSYDNGKKILAKYGVEL